VREVHQPKKTSKRDDKDIRGKGQCALRGGIRTGEPGGPAAAEIYGCSEGGTAIEFLRISLPAFARTAVSMAFAECTFNKRKRKGPHMKSAPSQMSRADTLGDHCG
jgi:hypothetical protein